MKLEELKELVDNALEEFDGNTEIKFSNKSVDINLNNQYNEESDFLNLIIDNCSSKD